MNKPYSILFQKMQEGAVVKDLLDDFGMVCTDFPFAIAEETKDLPKRDWMDEDGEDTYIPANIPLKAYDVKVGVCYKGSLGTAMDKMESFLDYLTGGDGKGSRMKIYNGKTHIGKQDVYLTKISGTDLWQDDKTDLLEFDMELHVCDPRTRIVPSYKSGSSTIVENLMVKG